LRLRGERPAAQAAARRAHRTGEGERARVRAKVGYANKKSTQTLANLRAFLMERVIGIEQEGDYFQGETA
jgi:hypothetical protein